MTTTINQIPTHWDADILAAAIAYEDAMNRDDGDIATTGAEVDRLDYLATGYRLAKAEDAKVLKALQQAAETLERVTLVQTRSTSIIQQTARMVARDLRVAIKAEGETQ